jgi:putative aldouronate transport system permease protein
LTNSKFHKHYYLMLLPGFIWLLLFHIMPMFGIIMAFQNFNPGAGVLHSKWVGMDNFKYMFTLSDSSIILRNTVVIAFLKIVGNLVVPLIFSLMLNEVRKSVIKRGIQTISYLPHFISWVILSGVMLDIFGYTGPINNALGLLGIKPILFFAKSSLFPYLLSSSDVWKEFGFNAILYLAALTGISPTLYEAAAIDGAGRFKRMIHVTLPGISVTMALLLVLSLGNVLNAGFEQVFNLYNPLVYSTGDIIDTWVYRAGLLNLQYSLATAVGLLKSVLGFVLITIGYYFADRVAGYRIF